LFQPDLFRKKEKVLGIRPFKITTIAGKVIRSG
jgi:hypothetical protein